MKVNWGAWFLPLLFIVIFIISTAVGVSEIIKEHAFLSKAELDDGTITDYQVDSSGKAVVFCPIIDFKTKSGVPHEYEGADCQSHPEDVPIGQHVQVLFDPQEPHRFQTYYGSPLSAYLDVSFGFFFGLLFLFIAAILAAVNLGQAAGQRRRQARAQLAAQQLAGYRASTQPFTSSPVESEASLLEQQARLKAAEAEVQRKLDERRRQ